MRELSMRDMELVSGAFGPAGISAMQAGALTIVGTQAGFYGGMAGGLTQRVADEAGTDYNNAAGTNYN